MKITLSATVVALLLLMAVPASAQFEQHPNDYGIADTLEMVFSVKPDFTTSQLQVQMDLYLFNDSNTLTGATTGFTWSNPNLQMDSAVADPFVASNWDLGVFFYEDGDIAITNANQRFVFGGGVLFNPGMPPTGVRQKMASYYFTLSEWNATDSIVLDTLEFSSGSFYAWVGVGNLEYTPYWTGPAKVFDTASPSNLVVAPDSLGFEGIEGGANPPSQTFDVSSTNNQLDFDVIETADWLVVWPLTGTTPATLNVQANTVGLAPGDYKDSIQIVSGSAGNSPQWVVVTLSVEPPPPTIGLSPTSFFFNAVQGGSNPASKFLTVTNTGGSTLNWTATNSSSWLTLVPASGVDSADIELQVDITGLTFGEYFDTVYVDDPAATNGPRSATVKLTVGSDLPILQVDSVKNYVNIPSYFIPDPVVTLDIKNAGAGAMNYWIEGGSPRITSISSDSGSAPDQVLVTISADSGSVGQTFFDTLTVYSNEAINSPVTVVIRIRYVDLPAILWVNRDTIEFNFYDCTQGGEGEPQQDILRVQNAGAENPMYYWVSGESEYFTLGIDSGQAPGEGFVTAGDLSDLPLGTYYDTIWTSSQTAVNSPWMTIVQINRVEADQDPEIYLFEDSIVLPTQENAGPELSAAVPINNRWGGCMEWELQENIPWMYPNKLSGNVPDGVSMVVNSSGFPFGEYIDTFLVVAPEATNSPVRMVAHMKVWRFRGDLNYDARVNIVDFVYFVDYLFNFGPNPQPERRVADLNCDRRVNVIDVTYFMDYLFFNGDIPCTNPYKK